MKYIIIPVILIMQNAYARTWSLDQVIRKTLENSRGIQILQAQKKSDKLILAEALSPFDWQIGWGYTLPKKTISAKWNREKFNSNFSLQKKWLYGLNFSTNYCYTTSEIPCSGGIPPSPGPQPYSKTISINIEQNIFRNFFGREDRLKLQSANYSYENLKFMRTKEVEKLILSAAEKFWNSYVLEIHVEQAKKRGRDYKELAGLAQKKSRLGHTRPGEIPQILSQYERAVKERRELETQFKNSIIDLKSFTQIEDKNLKFKKQDTMALPQVSPVKNIEKLNSSQTARSHYLSSLSLLEAQKYFYLPYVKVYGGADFSDSEKTWIHTLKSAKFKNYRAGISFIYPLSHSPTRWKRFGYLRSKKLQHELEYQDQKKRISDQLSTSWNQLKSDHISLKSSFKILKLQKQALDEIRKSYIQGRTPIDALISAQDRNTNVEKENLQAQKNYNLSLLKYYSLRDELISRYEK